MDRENNTELELLSVKHWIQFYISLALFPEKYFSLSIDRFVHRFKTINFPLDQLN